MATPGIDTFDNATLVEETIEMVEQKRADSVYIVTTPDTDASGDVLLAEDVIDTLDGQFDTNYTATYCLGYRLKIVKTVLIFTYHQQEM